MSYGRDFLLNYGIDPNKYNSKYDWRDVRNAEYMADMLGGDAIYPFVEQAQQWSDLSQLPINRVWASNGGTVGPMDITPSRKEAFNAALIQDLANAYSQMRDGTMPHPNDAGQPVRVPQAKSGEYLYRMLNPDVVVAPFAHGYNW